MHMKKLSVRISCVPREENVTKETDGEKNGERNRKKQEAKIIPEPNVMRSTRTKKSVTARRG